MKKLLQLLNLSVKNPSDPKEDRPSSVAPDEEKGPGKRKEFTNSEVMPGSLFEQYDRVLYRTDELLKKLK